MTSEITFAEVIESCLPVTFDELYKLRELFETLDSLKSRVSDLESDVHGPREPHQVFLFANGLAAAFDEKGEQIPYYQGRISQVLDRLTKDELIGHVEILDYRRRRPEPYQAGLRDPEPIPCQQACACPACGHEHLHVYRQPANLLPA